MASETLIVKVREHSFSSFLLKESLGFLNGRNWYLISTSSLKRQEWIQEFGRRRVLNPFDLKSIGPMKIDFIWVEDWPSLMGDLFDEFRYLVFSDVEVSIFSQTYEAPSWALRKLKNDFSSHQYILKENCVSLPLWPMRMGFIKFSQNQLSRAFVVYKNREKDFQVRLNLKEHSYYMNYSRSHRIIALHSSQLSIQDYNAYLQTLCRYLKNELRLHLNSLIDCFDDDKNRGNLNSKNSLSRSPHNRDSAFKKWKENYCAFLRWARWWKKA